MSQTSTKMMKLVRTEDIAEHLRPLINATFGEDYFEEIIDPVLSFHPDFFTHRDTCLLLDISDTYPKGSVIMTNRAGLRDAICFTDPITGTSELEIVPFSFIGKYGDILYAGITYDGFQTTMEDCELSIFRKHFEIKERNKDCYEITRLREIRNRP